MADLLAKLQDDITCSICQDYFRTPKLLGCLHRYCRDCLHKYILSKGSNDGVSCPTCRQTSKPLTVGVSTLALGEWADSFKTDFLLGSLVDNIKKEKKHGDVCTKHSGNPVVLFCRDCRKTICHVCAGVDHRRCDGVVPLRPEAERERAHINQRLTKMRTAKTIADQNYNHSQHQSLMLMIEFETTKAKAKKEFKKIHDLVNKQEKMCLNNLNKEYESRYRDVANTKHKNILNSVTESLKKAEKAVNESSDVEILNDEDSKRFPYLPVVIPIRNMKRHNECASISQFQTVLKKAKIQDTIAVLESAVSAEGGEESTTV
ncbi:tripartite motif-containing protein 10-like [Haliotis rubra]|uniref:tripartite motif-containing protein 10-like n=1 Tax=Haliotis rubra TaxID=36100 RepID=UPI001EE59B88|nr:tripartite motif-containing protein 10-like [Haliotis rubra]